MKLCFVSVNGARETCFVDEPRTYGTIDENYLYLFIYLKTVPVLN
jgi:hypothetical protein